MARVFRQILLDEMAHKETGARALAAVVKTETGFKRAARIIAEDLQPASAHAERAVRFPDE